MADRSRPGSSNAPRPAANANSAGVRRNLFQSHLTRRPTPGGASASTSAETLRLDAEGAGSDTSEIVVRDQHGEIELGDPPTPVAEDPEEVPLDDRQESESMAGH